MELDIPPFSVFLGTSMRAAFHIKFSDRESTPVFIEYAAFAVEYSLSARHKRRHRVDSTRPA